MPAHFNNKKHGSLGMSLIAGLSEDLEGDFSIDSNGGTIIKISFVYNMSVEGHETLAASFVSDN